MEIKLLEVLIRRRTSIKDLIVSRSDRQAVNGRVVVGKRVRAKGYPYLDGPACLYAYFLEALEGLDRGVRVVEALHIDLHHLFTVKSAAVGYRNGDVYAGTCTYRLL